MGKKDKLKSKSKDNTSAAKKIKKSKREHETSTEPVAKEHKKGQANIQDTVADLRKEDSSDSENIDEIEKSEIFEKSSKHNGSERKRKNEKIKKQKKDKDEDEEEEWNNQSMTNMAINRVPDRVSAAMAVTATASAAAAGTTSALPTEPNTTTSDDISDETGTTETIVNNNANASNENLSFKDLGLDEWIIDACRAVEIRTPTEIQRACIPEIIKGMDVIGGAKTGSGKTAAFALPILQSLAQDPYGVFAIVLTPTRELAIQISEQFTVFGKSINLKVCVIVGGLDMIDQALQLTTKRPHIVVATPGRLADHIISNPGAICFDRIKYLVLDEADRLLTNTFASDLQVIMEKIPSGQHRQTLLFTATMTPVVSEYMNRKGKQSVFQYIVDDADGQKTVSSLKQYYIFVPGHVKDNYLAQLVLENNTKSMIIFVNKCKTAMLLNSMFRQLGFKSTCLNSKMSQHQRLESIEAFKAHKSNILISTSVGSRGLDIPAVEMVVNFDLPLDTDDYIHRVGRTARAGRPGDAVSLVSEKDVELVHAIEERVGCLLEEYPAISEKEVADSLGKVIKAKRIAVMNLLDNRFGERDRTRKRKHEHS